MIKVPFVDLKAQYHFIKKEVDEAIWGVLENASFIGGPIVKNFASEFAERYGVKNCVPVANGTDAIYITLKMLGIGAGDEVITTAHSWISTSETITQAGAKPVFVDVEEDFFTINADLIEEKITEKTKAIIPVHIYGQMCGMDKIMSIAKKYDLKVIEDCAQSHFSEFNGTRAGHFGDAATFSFYPGKNLGAYGDAGAIITNNDELAEKMRMFANHGALIKHQHQMEGINSRLDTLQAAVLSVKLKYIEDWTASRIRNAALYSDLLKDVSSVQIPLIRDNSVHSFHLYVIRTDNRDELKSNLAEAGVQTAIHYPTILPLLDAYQYLGHRPEDFPVASANQSRILSLPMFPELNKAQIQYVRDKVKEG